MPEAPCPRSDLLNRFSEADRARVNDAIDNDQWLVIWYAPDRSIEQVFVRNSLDDIRKHTTGNRSYANTEIINCASYSGDDKDDSEEVLAARREKERKRAEVRARREAYIAYHMAQADCEATVKQFFDSLGKSLPDNQDPLPNISHGAIPGAIFRRSVGVQTHHQESGAGAVAREAPRSVRDPQPDHEKPRPGGGSSGGEGGGGEEEEDVEMRREVDRVLGGASS